MPLIRLLAVAMLWLTVAGAEEADIDTSFSSLDRALEYRDNTRKTSESDTVERSDPPDRSTHHADIDTSFSSPDRALEYRDNTRKTPESDRRATMDGSDPANRSTDDAPSNVSSSHRLERVKLGKGFRGIE